MGLDPGRDEQACQLLRPYDPRDPIQPCGAARAPTPRRTRDWTSGVGGTRRHRRPVRLTGASSALVYGVRCGMGAHSRCIAGASSPTSTATLDGVLTTLRRDDGLEPSCAQGASGPAPCSRSPPDTRTSIKHSRPVRRSSTPIAARAPYTRARANPHDCACGRTAGRPGTVGACSTS